MKKIQQFIFDLQTILNEDYKIKEKDLKELVELSSGYHKTGILLKNKLAKPRSLSSRVIYDVEGDYEDDIITIKDLEKPETKALINRTRLQLSKLIDWIEEKSEDLEGDSELRKQLYESLFNKKDETEIYDIMSKLNELWDQTENFLERFEGVNDRWDDVTFPTSPERLMSPQEIALQTSRYLSPDDYNWNEINLDIEASGGGKKGGVYPIGLLMDQQLIERLISKGDPNNIFQYAKDHNLPIFFKPEKSS